MTSTDTASATPLLRAFSRELARAGGLLSPDYLESGLSLGAARCLYELGHSEGLTVTALAARLSLDLGYVSRVVSRLVASGLATKRVERDDERSRRVTLTAKGRAELATLGERADARLGAWLAAKPPDVVEELAASLRSFVDDGRTEREDDRRPARRVVIRGPRPGSIGHIIARHGELYVAELGYPPEFEGYVVAAFADFLETFTAPRDRIFIAESAGKMLGSIAVKGLPDRTAQLRFLLVEPEARGRGLGKRLVRRVVDHAREVGERRVVLDTASDLHAARAIYGAEGFRKIRSVAGAHWLPAGVHSERWQLDLDR